MTSMHSHISTELQRLITPWVQSLQHLPAPLAIFDVRRHLVFANASLNSLFQLDDDVLGRFCHEVLCLGHGHCPFETQQEDGTTLRGRFHHTQAGTMTSCLNPVVDEQARVHGYVCLLSIEEEQANAVYWAGQDTRNLAAVLEHTSDLIQILDQQGCIRYVNRIWL